MSHRVSVPKSIGLTALFLVLYGLALVIPGVRLIALGDTPYYAMAGVATILSGVLLLFAKPAGLWVYAMMLIGSVAWVLSRVGLDGWRMLPPLALPVGIGLWVFGPWVAGKLSTPMHRARVSGGVVCGMGSCFLAFILMFGCGWLTTAMRFEQPSMFPSRKLTSSLPTANTEAKNDWRFFGGTAAGDRFTDLGQINQDNAHLLKRAWIFHTGDLPRKDENARGREFSFEATPIKVGSRLFFCTPHRDVIALDATTGKQVWRYTPGGNYNSNIYQACRGVSYFEATPDQPCPHRIISTNSGSPPTLFALDAETGRLCEGFGDHGIVNLQMNMGIMPPGFHFITSPPMVIHNRIMLSGWVYDNQSVDEPSGVIRGFDATTGHLVWGWDVGHNPANRALAPGEIFTRGTPNGWGVYTADPKLNMVYVPLGIATPDYFGGKRRDFDEKYDSSLVALDITTGEERWHFQTTHHDIWDFDLPVGPSLVDLPNSQGSMTPALVQTTKQGELFVLDRRTGKPFYRVDEKPVSAGDIPGEHYAPTQPVSSEMPDLRRHAFDIDQMWGITPFDQMACRIRFKTSRFEGLYTPPSVQGTLGFPAFDGMTDWYGASIDPVHGVAYINTTFIPFLMTLFPHEQALKEGLFKPWGGWHQPYPEPKFSNNPQHGLPYSAVIVPWLGPLGAPCLAPPWGKTQAIDLVHRRIIWERPIGTTHHVGPTNALRSPVALPTGIFSMGGILSQSNGLIFMAATADQEFRVIDGHTGNILFETELDAGGNATPMTYEGENGRQYVVLSVGGHGGLKTRNGDEIVAFALPQQMKAQ